MKSVKKSDLWIAAEEEIERQLLSDERLLWSGPCVRVSLRSDEWFLLIVMGAGLLLFWYMFLPIVLSSSKSSNGVLGEPGLLILLIGMSLVGVNGIVRPILNWWTRKRTFYAITDQRVIVRSHALQRRLLSIYPQHMKQFELVDHGNGIGDVVLGYEAYEGFGTVRVPFGLLGIENAREVEALMLRTFREQGRRQPD